MTHKVCLIGRGSQSAVSVIERIKCALQSTACRAQLAERGLISKLRTIDTNNPKLVLCASKLHKLILRDFFSASAQCECLGAVRRIVVGKLQDNLQDGLTGL